MNDNQCTPYNPILRNAGLCSIQDIEIRMATLEKQQEHLENIVSRMEKSVDVNKEVLQEMHTILSNRMFLEKFLKWVVATFIAGFTLIQGFNWVVEQNQYQGNNPQYVTGRDKEIPLERRSNARD